MRTITFHHTNDANKAITVQAEERNEDGRCDGYLIGVQGLDVNFAPLMRQIPIQAGPIKEVGPNGWTIELLLALAIDQLEGHQSGKYANMFNAAALDHVERALAHLVDRTREREARGVEGTHEV